jgi:DEAD/DEAH box helicase/MrfA Zn-binding domain/Helicase conserved C-terminal domain
MINGAELAQGLKDRLLSYMSSALPVGNHESQKLLGQRFFESWQRSLFKGPYFETIPPYERLKSLEQRFDEKLELPDDRVFAERFRPKYLWADVDHKFPFARPVRDRIWSPESQEADLEKSTTTQQALWTKGLFKHQWDAFSRAVYKKQNVVVATGTGSGKTECFQLPILYRLLTEPPGIRERRGVRALLVYPLNALVEDQSARLRRLLFWINLQFHEPRGQVASNHQITFGRYTGDTPVNANDFGRRESDEALKGLGELVYREDMQACPPDILITNFTMLEYMLLREDDRQLFGNPELFSFVVLDEIHTYSGTQGMEVAMLLRRLRGFLEGKSRNPLHIQCVGTSATLGGSDAKSEAAVFASTLLGTPFDSESIVLGTRAATRSGKPQFSHWSKFLNFLSEQDHDSLPSLLRDEEPGSESTFWNRLTQSLGIPDAAIDRVMPPSERLGTLLVESGLAGEVRAMIENQVDSCIDLDSLAEMVSGNVEDPKVMVGEVLSLLASATHNHEPVLALRTHLFINEAKSGQLCLYQKCEPAPGGADAWWRRLYVAHHTSCDVCGSRVYSALLCRRCGFVYLEGWCSQFILWPERDSAEKPENYERWIFRPADSDLPEVARESGGARTLCLKCGRYFVGRDRETFATSQSNHNCPQEMLLDIWVWRPEDLEGGKLESCLFCEQHWFPGEEVITGPAPSTYAVSTLLLEELKRQFSASGAISKIISFSDTRQQAAQLALRLQGTNRDFSFRQMVYQSMSETGLSTDDLLDELFDFSKADTKLRIVLAADPARPAGNSELREQLATLLYREAVTAYLTLEAQGLVRVQYDRALFDTARQLDIPSRIIGRLSEKEKRYWFSFLLDWGMRFVRYALGAHKWGGPSLNYDDLKEWNIYPKTAAIVGAKEQEIVGFSIKQRNRRNTVFNFASRLLRRGFGDLGELDIEEFHAATKPFWNSVLACPHLWVKDALTATRPLLHSGGSDPERCLIQLNFSSLSWRKTASDDPLFRCDHCGRLTFYSIRGICPIRDCRGTLKAISHRDIEENTFSPVRHYRKLVTSAAITPLRVEEHTAQISSGKRIAIERDFRSTAEDSIDVVCGSTTFELGIDLGSIQSVFMSNLPPRAANYRQRAGRAGRRPGAQPFVLNYVRQRPHDQYFWNAPQTFIAGPLPVPRLSISSKEVVLRHVSAILVGRLLELYRKEHPGRMALAGPPAEGFVDFAISSFTDIKIQKELENKQPLSGRLDHFLQGLSVRLDKSGCWADLRGRLRSLKDTYLSLHGDDGCLDVLSDHGILPSYAFPIYVDELRLREYPLREPPRSDLKLQRDRSIALREYSPGRAFVAGKYQILSEGLWNGYELMNFSFCPQCSSVDFRSGTSTLCSKCRSATVKKRAVVPRGGFFGRVIRRASESIDQNAPEVTDVYFDPAEDPPPQTRQVGQGLTIALLDAREMRRSRMRMFNPRPNHDGLLMASRAFSDAALPHSPPAACLERIAKGQGERLHLMHEFTTDILQMRFVDNPVGRLILESQLLQDEIQSDIGKREWLYESIWFTIATSLSLSGAQILDIDPTEIAVVLRRSHESGTLGHREVILYDTTAGGAGYVRQLGDRMSELFAASLQRLANCDCQDSCYACLRTYHNQLIHTRLNRQRVSDGFSRFVKTNCT